jgi:ribonucleotide reductase beta subunit family protein with ferritin-like domain/glutaredoxin
MEFTLFTKKDCPACEVAKEMLITHGIQNVHVVVKTSLYQVIKEFDVDSDMVSFPVFYDGSALYSSEQFFSKYGEFLLTPNYDRFVVFPITYPDMWDAYEKALASFWTVNEINFSQDEADFHEKLNDNERTFIKNILAFFAASDGIVNENLARNFSDEVQVPEARAFYSYQQFNETIHSHTYSLMIDRYVTSKDEKNKLLRGIDTIPSIRKKADWALKWIHRDQCPSFAKRLIAFACVEGIMFSGAFCAIFWLKKRGLMHGLSFSNELISRDEGTHLDFAVLLFKHLRHKPTQSDVTDIVSEAVEHEKEFITASIPCRLVGMNDQLMSEYIEYVADRLMLQLGYSAIYHTKNPFDFMEHISLSGKTNFFERRVGEYAKAGVVKGLVDTTENSFGIDADF